VNFMNFMLSFCSNLRKNWVINRQLIIGLEFREFREFREFGSSGDTILITN
jgi:hypothetical protein